MLDDLFTKATNNVVSKKLWITLITIAYGAATGDAELVKYAALGYLGITGVQNVTGIVKNGAKKEPVSTIPQEPLPKPSVPQSSASEKPTGWVGRAVFGDTDVPQEPKYFNSYEPFLDVRNPAPPDYTLIDPGILMNYKRESIGDVPNKAFLLYDALVKAGSSWNYYEDAPYEVRVPDALKWMSIILPVAQRHFKEVTGLDAPKSLKEIGDYKMYLMKVRNEVKRVTGSCVKNTNGWRAAISELMDAYNNIESLKKMQSEGVSWDMVPPEYNNPYGLGDMGYAFVKE